MALKPIAKSCFVFSDETAFNYVTLKHTLLINIITSSDLNIIIKSKQNFLSDLRISSFRLSKIFVK